MDSNIYVSKIISTADGTIRNNAVDSISNVSTIGSDDNLNRAAEFESIKSRIQADSLVQQHHEEENEHDLSVDFHDSLDESVSDIEHDDDDDDNRSDVSGSSTSTESLIERSRKYLTDEAGIIILKTKKLPRKNENFDIILNFDIDGSNKQAQKLKIEHLHKHQDDISRYLEEQKKYAIESGEKNEVIIDEDTFNWKNIVYGNQPDTKSIIIHDSTERYVMKNEEKIKS
jgi:hypothetical protein